ADGLCASAHGGAAARAPGAAAAPACRRDAHRPRPQRPFHAYRSSPGDDTFAGAAIAAAALPARLAHTPAVPCQLLRRSGRTRAAERSAGSAVHRLHAPAVSTRRACAGSYPVERALPAGALAQPQLAIADSTASDVSDQHNRVAGARGAPGEPGTCRLFARHANAGRVLAPRAASAARRDRKSTRLNSSHVKISYAVVC